MDNKDNLTAKEQELLEARNALSSKEVAEMGDFSIPLGNGEMIDISKYVDLYPDPHIPLNLQENAGDED